MATDTQPSDIVAIAAEGIRAEISSHGAELVRLQDEAGRDLLWNGDPAFWTGRAPLLFPIVGRLKGDRLTVDGVHYPMRQHGFARQSRFEVGPPDPALCRMSLSSNAETRAIFPFEFRLEASYAVARRSLDISIRVENLGHDAMPVSMGFHPALRWPLPYGAERTAHEILFEREEPKPLRLLVGGLVSPDPRPNPVTGRRLALNDALFTQDALVFEQLDSRSLRYGPAQGRGLRVDFPDMPDLGIWTTPGAGFLCIEPWQGIASPETFDGEFKDKPGTVEVAPGRSRHFGMTITLDPP